MENHPVVQRWLRRIEGTARISNDVPNYWSTAPQELLTTSNTHGNIKLGTGYSIYSDSILPAIEAAESEVILVTCFWAQSATLSALGDSLRKLSAKAVQQGSNRIKVRLCFSSLSLFQKLFHTSSLRGQTYSPSQWVSKLGLPSSQELQGLDLEVKSIFIRPFSVLHPKLVIIDRQFVFLPSCNISWEDWFEGCILLSGDVVAQFVKFWTNVWASHEDGDLVTLDPPPVDPKPRAGQSLQSIPSLFLPSPHHRNPNFSPLPWRPCPLPPPTPLNTFLLAVIDNAQRSIYLQTPNLTSPPVLSALLAALKRGVNVQVATSERLMILEQLVTAGTTTGRCVRTLVKRYRRVVRECGRADDGAIETGKPGTLRVGFYRPCPTVRRDGGAEPVQSHLKLTIVDGEWTVLGSGNMDRASWFTSQELGLAFLSSEFAGNVLGEVRTWMDERALKVYDSSVSA